LQVLPGEVWEIVHENDLGVDKKEQFLVAILSAILLDKRK
jgi:hypothetical protein